MYWCIQTFQQTIKIHTLGIEIQTVLQQLPSNQIHVTFLIFHRTQHLIHMLTESVPPSPQQPPVVVKKISSMAPLCQNKICVLYVCIYVWRGKRQNKRHDSVVLMIRLTLGGGRQWHHKRFTWDQRAFVTDSVSHAPPLVSEVSFRWPMQTSECEAQQLATSF